MKIIPFILLIILIVGCSVYIEEDVQFQTISKGSFNSLQEKSEYVIKNNEDWKNLWHKINSFNKPESNLPGIDFNKSIIIAVFQGQKNTGGYNIEIKKIIERKNYIEVQVKENNSSGRFIIEAITSPYHIVKINRLGKEIKFIYS